MAPTDSSDEEDPFAIAGIPGLREVLDSLYTGVGAVADLSDEVLLSSVDPESGNSETPVPKKRATSYKNLRRG